MDENQIVMEYNPPSNFPPPFYNITNSNATALNSNPLANKPVQWVYNPSDGSVLRDHHGQPLSVDKLLATEPLKHELSTRPGPGNKKLTYISGDEISRTLNDVFGFDGWDLDIREVEKVDTSKDPKSQLCGTGGPGHTIPDEHTARITNAPGTLSMANSGPNSGGSQFFVNTKSNSYLDWFNASTPYAHPVFGKVTEGYDIVLKISAVQTDRRDSPITPIMMESIDVHRE